MATTFKYAGQSDLKNYFNSFGEFDQKVSVHNWESLGNNVYVAHDTGYTTQLFQDGKELSKTSTAREVSDSTVVYKANMTDSLAGSLSGDSTKFTTITYNASFGTGDEDDIQVGDYILVTKTAAGTSIYEYCLIESINTGANQITVRRGALGTTAILWLVTGDDLFFEFALRVRQDNQWFYDSYYNQILLYSTTDPNDGLIESGVDFSTFADQQLVNASMELNNLLDARFQMPLPKSTQIKEGAASGLTPEYDPIVIKCTCYIAAANLIRSKDPMSEEGQFFYDMVTNTDGTGFVDKLNAGNIKLSFEIDNKDSQGSIRQITNAGSMYLVETEGEFYGGKNGYDLLRITCTTAGAYGVAKCKVEYYGNDKLFGNETTDNIVTGGIDKWSGLGGIGIRFQGSAMVAGGSPDQWEIEVYSEGMEETNSVVRNISLYR